MRLWTLFGLREGKATTAWPLGEGGDGQAGVLGMPRYHPELCREGCAECAEACPTRAITLVDAGAAPARRSKSITGAASSANCAPKHARPGRWRRPRIGPLACAGARTWCGNPSPRPPNRSPPPSQAPIPAFRRSLHIRHVDAGSCNGCESELQALNNPFYNLHRLGIFFTASPRFADLLLVTGPVTYAMQAPLRAAFEAMPEPRWVMATGTCAVSGGIAAGGYASGHGLDGILPVDLYLPGCPPNPAAMIEALLMFLRRKEQRVVGGRLAE